MAASPSPIAHRPELEVTDARQARHAPGLMTILAISTVAALLVIFLVWAFWAGPLRHPADQPRVDAPAAVEGSSQPPYPNPQTKPAPNNTGSSRAGDINAR